MFSIISYVDSLRKELFRWGASYSLSIVASLPRNHPSIDLLLIVYLFFQEIVDNEDDWSSLDRLLWLVVGMIMYLNDIILGLLSIIATIEAILNLINF